MVFPPLLLLLFALAMGSWGLWARRLLPWPPMARFLAGAASTPFVLSALVFVIGLVWRGAPRLVFVWAPVVLAVGWLALYGVRALWAARSAPTLRLDSLRRILLFICFVLMVGLATQRMVNCLFQPIISHDIAHYLTEARYFVEFPDSLAINSGIGAQLGTVHPDDHGPFYVCYYAYAMLLTPGGAPVAHSEVYNVFAHFNFACMAAAFTALALAIKKSYLFAMLSILFMLQAHRLYYIWDSQSRDGYFLAAIALFVLMLLGLARRLPTLADNREKTSPGLYIYAGWTSLCLLQGHGWGALIFACGGAVLLGFCLARRVPLRRQLALYAAMGTGAALGLVHMALRFLRTGKLRSYIVDYAIGSPLRERYLEQDTTRPGGLDAFLDFWRGSQGLVLLLGFAACVVAVILALRARRLKLRTSGIDGMQLFGAVLFLVLCLPIFGLFGPGVFSSMVGNFRYAFYLYFLAPIPAALLLFRLCRRIFEKDGRVAWARSIITGLASVVTFFSIVLAWPGGPQPTQEYADALFQAAEAAENAQGAGRIMTDLPAISIYFEQPTLMLMSAASEELIAAEGDEAVANAFAGLNVTVFVSQQGNAPGFEETDIYAWLEANAQKESISQGANHYTVYTNFTA